MGANELQVYRGDDKTFNLTFKDSDGNAIDITGDTIYFTVKKKENDVDANALIQKTVTSHSDPTNGITAIDLTDSDTDIDIGLWHFDIQRKVSSGEIQTILKDRFRVDRDITITTS